MTISVGLLPPVAWSLCCDALRNLSLDGGRCEQGLPLPLRYFFFNDTATTEIYTLSLHDALPIWMRTSTTPLAEAKLPKLTEPSICSRADRKSTRLNSSHMSISYAVFCLKKKKKSKFRTFSRGAAQTPSRRR